MDDRGKVCSSAGGALGLGGLAAALGLCCSVPWAATLLGVTGAVALARLAFLLPYALVGAAALLSYSFWLAYRKPTREDGPDDRRSLRRVVWVASFVVLGFAIVALTKGVSFS